MGYARYVGISLLVLTFALPSQEVQAAKKKRIKVLGMSIESDDLSAKDKKDLFRAVQARLRTYPKVKLLNPPSGELTDIMVDLECVDLDVSCLSKVGKRYKADRVFFAQVKKVKGSYVLNVQLVHVRRKRVLHKQTVTVKSIAALANAMDSNVTAAFGAPPKKPVVAKKKPVVVKKKPIVVKKKPVVVKKKPVVVKRKPTVLPQPTAKKKRPGKRRKRMGLLKIRSMVPGARIYVGKTMEGIGRIRLRKPPGVYIVRIKSPGYHTLVIKLTVRSGKVTSRSVKLRWAAKTFKPPITKKPQKQVVGPVFYKTWWFWTAVGGVVLTSTLIAIAAGSGGGSGKNMGNAVFSVDPQNAWRDAAVRSAR